MIDSRPDAADFDLYVRLVQRVFNMARWLSPMYWLSFAWPALNPPSRRSPEEDISREYHQSRVRAVDRYVTGCLLVEIALVLVVLLRPLAVPWAVAVASCFAGVRICDIIQTTVNATLFNPLRSIGNRAASRVRLVVLAFVNIVELCVCFGVVYAADYTRLHGAGQPATGFYLSVITQLTIGFGDVYPTGYLRAVAAAQGLLGLAFFILVFARVVASLPQLEEILQPSESAPNSRTPR